MGCTSNDRQAPGTPTGRRHCCTAVGLVNQGRLPGNRRPVSVRGSMCVRSRGHSDAEQNNPVATATLVVFPPPAARAARSFLATYAGSGVAASVVVPLPVDRPAAVLGAASPSNRINVRAYRHRPHLAGHDLPASCGTTSLASCRVLPDKNRWSSADAKVLIERPTPRRPPPYTGARPHRLSRAARHPDIDAVVISTPDHHTPSWPSTRSGPARTSTAEAGVR